MNIPNGNISYSRLKSTIDKDEIYRTDNYPVTTDSRYYDTGDGAAEIEVLTETWKYEQNLLPNLKLELFKSYASLRKQKSFERV